MWYLSRISDLVSAHLYFLLKKIKLATRSLTKIITTKKTGVITDFHFALMENITDKSMM